MFAMVACKKDTITIPESNDPIFRLDGTFGSDAISIVAGDNDGFMYTMTDTENGVEIVSGKLLDNTIGVELGIFNGGLNNSTEEFNENMSLTPVFSSHYGYPIASLSKDLFINAAYIENIEWVVDGGQPVLDSVQITEPGKYEVCAHIMYNNSMAPKTLCNQVIVGYNQYQNESINFDVNSAQGGASTWIDNSQGTIDFVDWYYNDSFYIRADSCFKNLGSQMYKLTAVVNYTNGVVQTKNMLIDGGVTGSTIEDFTLFEDNALSIIQDYNIRVKVNSNGLVYRSDFTENGSSIVEISSVELYGLNDQGNKVYKVEAAVQCNVSNTPGGNSIPLEFNTSFGFEIK